MNFGRMIKNNSLILSPAESAENCVFSSFNSIEKEIPNVFISSLKDFKVRYILVKTNKISNCLVILYYQDKEVMRQYVIGPSSFYIRQILETFGENGVYQGSLENLIDRSSEMLNIKFIFDKGKNKIVRASITMYYSYDATEEKDPETINFSQDYYTFSLDLISLSYQLLDMLYYSDKPSFNIMKIKKDKVYSPRMVMFLGATQSGKSTSVNYAIENRGKGIYKLDKGKISYFRIGEPELTVLDVDIFRNEEGSISNWLDVFYELAFGKNPNVIVDSTRTLGRLSSFNLMSQGISSDIVDIFTYLPKLSAFVEKNFVVVHNPLESDPAKLQGMVELFHSSIPLIFFFPNSLIKETDSSEIDVVYNEYNRSSGNKLGERITYIFSPSGNISVQDASSKSSSFKIKKNMKHEVVLKEDMDIESDMSINVDSDFKNF